MRYFNDSLQQVEDSFRDELQILETQQQSKENHSVLLNKEMSAGVLQQPFLDLIFYVYAFINFNFFVWFDYLFFFFLDIRIQILFY